MAPESTCIGASGEQSLVPVVQPVLGEERTWPGFSSSLSVAAELAAGLCRLQPQVLHVRLEVAVAEQQRQVGIDAGGGDNPVNGLTHRDSLAAQQPDVFCCFLGIAAAEHRQHGQRAEQLPGGGHIALAAEPLHDLDQDEIADRQRRHPEHCVQPLHLWGAHPIEKVAPDRGVDHDHG